MMYYGSCNQPHHTHGKINYDPTCSNLITNDVSSDQSDDESIASASSSSSLCAETTVTERKRDEQRVSRQRRSFFACSLQFNCITQQDWWCLSPCCPPWWCTVPSLSCLCLDTSCWMMFSYCLRPGAGSSPGDFSSSPILKIYLCIKFHKKLIL